MHYNALDTSKHEVRLLHLAPSLDRRRAIACHFIVVSLSHGSPPTQFEALSYAWGDPIFNRKIQLGGVPFAVTANLKAILRALRHPREERILWVDAVCIDQHNVQERSHQVSRMNDIYSHAEDVIVWLGEPLSDAELAFDFLREFGRQRNERSTHRGLSSPQSQRAIYTRWIALVVVNWEAGHYLCRDT